MIATFNCYNGVLTDYYFCDITIIFSYDNLRGKQINWGLDQINTSNPRELCTGPQITTGALQNGNSEPSRSSFLL